MRRWAIVNTLLGIIVALMGFEIVHTWARGLPRGAPAESAASAAPAPPPAPAPEPHEKGKRGRGDKAGALAQQTPAMLVSAIAEKDLFDPSRRPPSGPRPATPVRQPIPGRPPQPAGAQMGSPAAGVQGPSPAAGLGGRPPVPVAPQPAVGVPPKPGAPAPLPAQVQQKLDQLKQNDKRRRH